MILNFHYKPAKLSWSHSIMQSSSIQGLALLKDREDTINPKFNNVHMDQKEQKRQKHKGHYLICIDFINVHCNICKRNCPFLLSFVQMDATTPNVVGPTMLGVAVSVCTWLKVSPVSNFAKQLPTTCNRVCRKTQQCWELLADNDVASVCTGLYRCNKAIIVWLVS